MALLHPRHWLLLSLLVPALSLGGCTTNGEGSSGADDTHEGPSYYGGVKDILDARCGSCHQDGAIAPFSLSNYEEASALQSVIAHSIEQGSMPPWMPDNTCNDYKRDLSLTDQERADVLDWISAGAREGEAVVEEPGDPPTTVTIRPDAEITMAEPYTPQVAPDDYRCFVMDWDETEAKYVTGFKVNPGRPEMVHHVIAFVINPSAVDDFRAMDEADEGPGYTCFGSPAVGLGSVAGASSWRWLGSWTPGGGARLMPEDTGVAIQPGSVVVTQLHYNTLEAEPASDVTSIQFQLDDEVAKPALVMPITRYQWIAGSESMTIPAGSKDTVHTMHADISENFLGYIGSPIGLDTGDSYQIHSIGIHMHLLGTRGRIWLERADAGQQCLLDIPEWDFNWQGTYELQEPITVHSGDIFHMECQWDNSAENQVIVDGEQLPAQDIEWGDGTRSEMCLAIAYVTAP